ncbi:hypothetical protein ABW20_dc0107214 [Dactylellina cionopaga]|nr:hypothetical protein ABW20_dc0107214 [Dactylellina cionopaga]
MEGTMVEPANSKALAAYIASLPEIPASSKNSGKIEDRIKKGSWRLIDETGFIIRIQDWENIVAIGARIIVDTHAAVRRKTEKYPTEAEFNDLAESANENDQDEAQTKYLIHNPTGAHAEPEKASVRVPVPVQSKPVINEPIVNKPVANEPVINQSIATKPVVNIPVMNQTVANKPVINEPVTATARENVRSEPRPQGDPEWMNWNAPPPSKDGDNWWDESGHVPPTKEGSWGDEVEEKWPSLPPTTSTANHNLQQGQRVDNKGKKDGKKKKGRI